MRDAASNLVVTVRCIGDVSVSVRLARSNTRVKVLPLTANLSVRTNDASGLAASEMTAVRARVVDVERPLGSDSVTWDANMDCAPQIGSALSRAGSVDRSGSVVVESTLLRVRMEVDVPVLRMARESSPVAVVSLR